LSAPCAFIDPEILRVEGRTERRYLKHLSDALAPGSKVEYRARGPDWL